MCLTAAAFAENDSKTTRRQPKCLRIRRDVCVSKRALLYAVGEIVKSPKGSARRAGDNTNCLLLQPRLSGFIPQLHRMRGKGERYRQ